jgi:hypothetical protein
VEQSSAAEHRKDHVYHNDSSDQGAVGVYGPLRDLDVFAYTYYQSPFEYVMARRLDARFFKNVIVTLG